MNDGSKEQIYEEVVLPKSTVGKNIYIQTTYQVHFQQAISFLTKHLNITIIFHVIRSGPKTMTVTTPMCHCIFIFLLHKNEKNKISLRPLLNQIPGIQYFHFISP